VNNKIAIKKGRGVKKDLKIGICGEHGGEPKTVEFCHKEGFSYVSFHHLEFQLPGWQPLKPLSRIRRRSNFKLKNTLVYKARDFNLKDVIIRL
jgi:hypothetical protein